MLPEIANLEFDEIEESIPSTVHKIYAWDFTEGDFILFDGKMIELTGFEYIKTWIKKCLLTVAETLIYSGTNYGSEHHSLIGRTFNISYSKAEYERMIREALLVNDAITRVDNFAFSQVGSRLSISFDAHSIYGVAGEVVLV